MIVITKNGGGGSGITEDSVNTLTNKSIDADNNTITNIDNDEIKSNAGISFSKLETVGTDHIVGRTASGSGVVTGLSASQVRTLLNVEDGATADQTDAEIENAYNSQVSVVSQSEAETGTSTTVRRWNALRVKQAIDSLASGGLTVESKTTDYTITASDGNKQFRVSNATTITIPSGLSLSDSDVIDIVNVGSDVVIIDAGSGVTINNSTDSIVLAPWESFLMYPISVTSYQGRGDNPVSSGDAFISTWDTTNISGADTANDTIKIPLINSPNVIIDWGDGNVEKVTRADPEHTYSTTGSKTVKIYGNMDGFRFNGTGDHPKITDISQWGIFNAKNEDRVFYNCTNLDVSAVDTPDLSSTTTLSWWFLDCTSFNADISSWDVSNVTDMSLMFFGATSFNQDLSSWDITSVTNMTSMFANVTLSTANYDAILIGWEGQAVQNNVNFHGGNSTYTSGGAAETARTALINDHSWTITDGGVA